jgi:hypothetical protein
MEHREKTTCLRMIPLLAAGLILAGAIPSSPQRPAPYPLEKTVQDLVRPDAAFKDWKPTGVDERLYADLSEPIVRQAVAWQDETGRIIDPFVHTETPTATPRFVGALAGLILRGRCLDLADNCRRALTAAAEDLAASDRKPVAGAEFYTKELMLGYLALKDGTDAATVARWKRLLGGFDPAKNYGVVLGKLPASDLQNYTTFGLAGEMFKTSQGIADNRAFIEEHLATQLPRFTAFGMYRDPANPMLYDAVPRMNLSLFEFFGYAGPRRGDLDELLRRGALTMLLTMSPSGEAPYGGRSNQQNFAEAMAAIIFEFEAARYKKEGDLVLAGVFKRAARLSTLSVRRWLDLRPVRFIKNEFPPESQHGRQKSYGYYGAYSLLIASQFGFAGLVADPSIEERPLPVERGGYAFALDDDFHKVFATCAGYHLEIDTRADLHYDATGLGRIHKAGVPTETALSTPIAAKPEFLVSSPEAPRNVAIGPGWEEGGRAHWLSDCSSEIGGVEFKSLEQGPQGVKFEVIYKGLPGCDRLVETYTLGKTGLTVIYEAVGPVDAILVQVPIIMTDGSRSSTIKAGKNSIQVSYRGHVYEVECLKPSQAAASFEAFTAPNRNGLYKVAVFKSSGKSMTCRFSLETAGVSGD